MIRCVNIFGLHAAILLSTSTGVGTLQCKYYVSVKQSDTAALMTIL